jgi:MraZ protein
MKVDKLGFRGTSQHTIDAKGRIFIPTKYKEILGTSFVVFKWGKDKCLYAMSSEAFENFTTSSKLKKLPEGKAKQVKRALFSSAEDVEMDAQNRILIPAELRAHAHLDKDVAIVGIETRLEFWDYETWKTQEAADTNEVFESVGEFPDDFGSD